MIQNERGDMTLLSVVLILGLSGLVILSALELTAALKGLRHRANLILCVKESKGELHQFLKFMGKTNWAIHEANKVKWISLVIPGLQGLSGGAEKVKSALKVAQETNRLFYLKNLALLQSHCPIDPRMFQTPFELIPSGLKRHLDGTAKLRSNHWTYRYFHKSGLITLEIKNIKLQTIRPNLNYRLLESKVKLPSRSFTAF